jgi:ELWxxDGT repeat protein
MLDSLGVERYEVVRRVGAGGMGELYEVWDKRLQRRVAVKRLHPHVVLGPDREHVVLSEARAAARIEHPNVVRVYSIEQVGTDFLIEMQFIDGRPLTSVLNKTPLPVELAVDLLRQIMEGLNACHAENVIHCDLKPANILVHARGTVYLTDFGIARALRSPLDSTENNEESVPCRGTPRYSPPEAWRGEAPSVLWDIYAAGVVLYEALSGAEPFNGHTIADIRTEVARGITASVQALRPELSPDFARLIDSMLSNDVSRRPLSALAVLTALRKTPEYRAQQDQTSSGLVPSPQQTSVPVVTKPSSASSKPTASGRWSVVMSAVFLLALSEAHKAPGTPGRSRLRPMGWLFVVLAVAFAVVAAGYVYRQIQAPPSAIATAPSRTGTISAPVPVPVPAPASAPAPDSETTRAPSPEPTNFGVSGEAFYFSYDDGIHGREPWGLHNGESPVMIADLNPGPGSSDPENFVAISGTSAMFAAYTPETGRELWMCYGQDAHRFLTPVLVKDIVPGDMGSAPRPLYAWHNRLMFFANTLNAGQELWCTTGGADQTGMVLDANPGVESSNFEGHRIYVDGSDAYWVTWRGPEQRIYLNHYDFESNTLNTLGEVTFETRGMCKFKGKLYFALEVAGHGAELGRYDPETGTIGLFLDLSPGVSESSYPEYFYVWGDRLYFRARTPESDKEPWVTDGTPEGTHVLADLNPGDHGSFPFDYLDMGEVMIFRAHDDAHGKELWITDGTPAGTRMLADVYPGTKSGEPYSTARLGDKYFFSAEDGVHGEELWVAEKKDGQWRARLVADLNPNGSAYPHHIRVAKDGTAIFIAETAPSDVWFYRLTVAGDNVSITPLPRPGLQTGTSL